jgi:hypothetical protein
MRTRVLPVLLVTLAALPATLTAQTELGLDLGFSYDINSPTIFQLMVPTSVLRVGFAAGQRIEVEPQVSLQYFKVEDNDALTSLDAVLGILYRLSGEGSPSSWYVRPFGGIMYVDAGGSSATQFQLGGGIGVKLHRGDRFAWRIEGNFGHAFETDDFLGRDVIALTFGFSYFTR